MKKKQKLIATTLSTMTALSSVTALTNMPNKAMLSVQALEDTNETTKQTKPSNLEKLEKTVDEKNTSVVSAGTVLQGADTERENAKLKLNDAREKRNQNLEAMTKSADTVDNTLAKEIKARAQTVMDLQQKLSDQNKQKDELTKAIADKQAQLDEAQAKYDELQKELSDQDAVDKLNQISQEKTILESQLAQEKEQLDSLKEQINDQMSDEEIQKYNDSIDSTQAKIDADTARITELDEEYQVAYKQQIQEQSTKNSVGISELTQLKTELSNLQAQQAQLETIVADLTKQLKDAEDELSNAYVKYNDNVVSFYKEVYRETGSLDAYYAFTELEKYDGVEYTAKSTESGKIGTATIYDSKNYDQTIASLSDLKEAINYIKMANAIREYEGVSPLKISYYLMAISAIQNEYSSVTINHSNKYNVGENLYWCSIKFKSSDFLDANGKLDVDRLNKIGRGEIKGTYVDRYNPFYGWWIEEKVDYEKTHDSLNDGHYLNLVNGSYTLTGFSYNNQKPNYYYTWGQVFSRNISVKNIDGSGYASIDGVTVDEFEKILNDWILKKANGIQLEQNNVNTIKEKLESSQTKLDTKKQQVLQKQEEINNYIENINSQYQEAKEALEKAQKESNNLENEIEKTVSQLDTANKENDKVQKAQAQWNAVKAGTSIEFGPFDDATLDGLKDTVNTYIQTRKLSSTLEDALTKAQSEFDLADQKAKEALEAYEKVKADYDQAKAELDAFNEKHGVITVDTIIMPTQVGYTGKQIKPDILVKDSKGNQADPSEYTITYGENVEIGTGTVTIKMNGENYVGTFTKTFEIVKASPYEGWKKFGNNWYYYDDYGIVITGKHTINGKQYYFAENGVMQTGWFKIDNADYYASSSGEIKAQWVASGKNWYYVDAEGKMVTGFQTINGAKYYFETNGLMKKGWFVVDGTDYYASTSGEIKAQWVGSGNTWYYVDSDGKMVTGFQTIAGAKYYFASSGLMQKGWFKINGADYYATSSGAIKAQWVGSGNNWYYVDSDGKMVTGYQTIAGAKYYFASSGLMQKGWFKINGEDYYAASSGEIKAQWVKSGNKWYYVDAEGKMVTGDYEIDGVVNHFDANGVWLG